MEKVQLKMVYRSFGQVKAELDGLEDRLAFGTLSRVLATMRFGDAITLEANGQEIAHYDYLKTLELKSV